MRYIDSNLFIYAVLNDDDKGEKAREYIKKIRKGNDAVFTSVLTFDEVFWIVKREKNEENALKAGRAMLEMKNLQFVEVDTSLLWDSYKLIEKHGIDPRDSIHLACALKKDADKIISEDDDFDSIDKIEREWIL